MMGFQDDGVFLKTKTMTREQYNLMTLDRLPKSSETGPYKIFGGVVNKRPEIFLGLAPPLAHLLSVSQGRSGTSIDATRYTWVYKRNGFPLPCIPRGDDPSFVVACHTFQPSLGLAAIAAPRPDPGPTHQIRCNSRPTGL